MMDDRELEDWIIETRREFHRIPEVSFSEFGTQKKIMEILSQMGLNSEPIANTGVIAAINGKGNGKCLALRADMDGMEVTEEVTSINKSYISQHRGFMHACGHDGHMAIVLGAARLLMQRDFPGSVRLIFQPGEEQPPGGALDVIREGGLKGVDAIAGLHIFSSLNSGEIRFRPGPFLSASNIMTIKIRGKGGHHLNPELCIDPISIASRFIACVHDNIRKRIPQDRFILGFGRISGGSQFNRTPDEVEILGSFRTFAENDTQIIEATLEHTLEEIMEYYQKKIYPGVPSYGLEVQHGYPILVNDPAFSQRTLHTLRKYFPQVSDDIDPFFGAEDFAYYLQKVPGVYIGLGTRNPEKSITEGNHSSKFDIDEDILIVGARILAAIALDFLEAPEKYL